MVGYALELFVDPDKARKCHQCKLVLRDGVVACSTLHPVHKDTTLATCSSCYAHFCDTNTDHCPKCRVSLDSARQLSGGGKPPKLLSSWMHALGVKCFTGDPSCKWTGQFYEKDTHLKYDCVVALKFPCELACGARFPTEDKRGSHTSTCVRALVHCPQGGKSCSEKYILRQDLEEHASFCAKYRCLGCGVEGTREAIVGNPDHVHTPEEVEVLAQQLEALNVNATPPAPQRHPDDIAALEKGRLERTDLTAQVVQHKHERFVLKVAVADLTRKNDEGSDAHDEVLARCDRALEALKRTEEKLEHSQMSETYLLSQLDRRDEPADAREVAVALEFAAPAPNAPTPPPAHMTPVARRILVESSPRQSPRVNPPPPEFFGTPGGDRRHLHELDEGER